MNSLRFPPRSWCALREKVLRNQDGRFRVWVPGISGRRNSGGKIDEEGWLPVEKVARAAKFPFAETGSQIEGRMQTDFSTGNDGAWTVRKEPSPYSPFSPPKIASKTRKTGVLSPDVVAALEKPVVRPRGTSSFRACRVFCSFFFSPRPQPPRPAIRLSGVCGRAGGRRGRGEIGRRFRLRGPRPGRCSRGWYQRR